MGNKLCAPLLSKKANHPQHSQPWHTRKDSNLLRLWAEIFHVVGHGDYMQWKRVSDDVVPINITCVEDSPKTIYQVTAYNRHVEKIFDIKIVQPGTILCPATDCFVHWRDTPNNSEWGLNFTTSQDAKRFRDSCSFTSQKYARKASSANSLRLSPPKSKGQPSVSSPNSPIHDPRRVISSPYDLNQVEPCECITPSTEREAFSRDNKAATIPRTQNESGADNQKFQPRGILKPSSGSSGPVYETINHCRQSVDNLEQGGHVYQGPRSASAGPLTYGESQAQSGTKQGPLSSFGKSPSRTCENIRVETAFVGKFDSSCDLDQNYGRKSVTIATKHEEIEQDPQTPVDNENQSVVVHKDCIRILAPQPQKLTSDSHNSESPEWPSPPEPLTPQTPQTPTYNLEFDSDSIKRMLENLPMSPETDSMTGSVHEHDQGFHEDPTCTGLKKQNQNCSDNKGETTGAECSTTKCDNRPSQLGSPQLLDCEIAKRQCARDSFGRDSNPDSGIGGISDVAVSLSSGESAHMQATGLDVTRQDLKGGGSTGTSSHDGSSSCSHLSQSDLISQLTEGQFMSAEISDDEAGSDDSIHTVTEAESQFSYAKQQGAIRKAGWLVVKNWLVQKKKKLELAPRRTWKRYWVCLKGTVLLFYDGDIDNVTVEETVPRHILVIEGGISQAVPEHPKRDNIFSLSTAFGDAYLFQASSQTELDSWVCAIHSACAGSYARQHGKDNIVRLLRSELHKLETNIDIDVKMRKMAELQLTVVSDPRSRQAIIKQIRQWEENIEKLYIEQYRLRCYSASIQGSELPNPKVLLSNISKASKVTLSRLGIFTVSSFHALVCARKPLVMPSLYGKGHQKGGLLSPKGDGMFKYHSKSMNAAPSSHLCYRSVYKAAEIDEVVGDMMAKDGRQSPSGSTGSSEILSKVTVPNNQSVTVGIKKSTTAEDVLTYVCNRRQLNPRDHYVRVRLQGAPEGSYQYPNSTENIKKLKCELVEVCQKHIYQVELCKGDEYKDYGLKIEAELAEDCDRDDDLRIYVANVRPDSLADRKGLKASDEIVIINSKVVSELDMVYVESLLTESDTIYLTVRSLYAPSGNVTVETPESCPPPPSQSRISDNSIDNLKIPPPSSGSSSVNTSCHSSPHTHVPKPKLSTDQVDALLQGADQVTAICRESNDEGISVNRQLSEVERLRKVIMELVDTEKAYVKDLNCLLERYLEPLKEEMFLTSDEIDNIFGNIQEIALFQRQFLHSLEEAIQLDSPFFHGTDIKHYRRVLFSLGGSFLFYANHFKVYSSFCASHSRSQKILNPDTINEKLKEFLIARNPKHQHSSTLDSYLIKPIQRILKYPLLLQQLCNLTDPDTDEHHHLSEARKGMEAVAEHINEMQKIYEEYGAIFDELSKMFKDLYPVKKPVDLSVGELQMYGTVEWCNVSDSLGKIKKGTELESTVFVFKTGVVFLCRERLKRKKTRGGTGSGKGLFSESYETIERFRTLIPVQDVQVKLGQVSDIDDHYWWELVHSRSDSEGRPERVYQFCNSTNEAKTDFMRIIRQTIRDSVRKMTLPSNSQSSLKSKYIPCGGKRLEALSSNPRSTLSKKRNSSNSKVLDERHSMELDGKISVDEDGVFRTRSKTVGDLNEVSFEDHDDETCVAASDLQIAQNGTNSETSSCSNLSVSSHSGSSAKLTFASANPLKYCSAQTKSPPTSSPIWKPRNEANVVMQQEFLAAKLGKDKLDYQKVTLSGADSKDSPLKDTEC
ncbi:protein still life, isoform SIF type 1-like isoform X1 [Mercenaria mercenaria]|uniref:protein still life, isoform SIF type 1-like isoform X1 n=1 Tax=Mercenaria mercenaria TaxID=6596 RepID=UPI00234E6BAC|nr:protein still life, isoform SIF type 1-like isoform X1 [Mercenaria mercenaria]XP_053396920.1 protein still life, isoform SIF type 1-like isoform X1 [Mercenaria mercenaria]